MRALTVEPGVPDSAALSEVGDISQMGGALRIASVAVGICGTDREIINGSHGRAPPGRDRLILGHEALGRVVDHGGAPGFSVGDLVVPFVRCPDPVPCAACAVGEWDMCRNGLYTEHGIKEVDGFMVDEYVLPPSAVVNLDGRIDGLVGVLIEPASIVAKAWRHIEAIGSRAAWDPERVFVTGAGPIGLLSAFFAVHRGYEVHVLDVVTDGPKPALVRDVGATYHTGTVEDACSNSDIVIECTGVPRVVIDVLSATRPAGVVCLTGISGAGRHLRVDVGALNRELVLENDVVIGSVNANATDYRDAVEVLGSSDQSWLSRLLTRVEPIERWRSAMERRNEDVKVALRL